MALNTNSLAQSIPNETPILRYQTWYMFLYITDYHIIFTIYVVFSTGMELHQLALVCKKPRKNANLSVTKFLMCHSPNHRMEPTCPIFTHTANMDFNSDPEMIATMTLLHVTICLCSINNKDKWINLWTSLCELNPTLWINLFLHCLNWLCMFITTYLSEDEFYPDSEDYEAPFTIHGNANGNSEGM